MSRASEAFCQAVAAGDLAAAGAAATAAMRDDPSMRVATEIDCGPAVAKFTEWLMRCGCVTAVEATSGLLKSEPPQKLLVVETTCSASLCTLHLTLSLDQPINIVSIRAA
jgi:hypothetical protein